MNPAFEQPIFIVEQKVKSFISWRIVNNAVEQALRASSNKQDDSSSSDNSQPYSNQPARNFTFAKNQEGVLLTMPGFIGNYKINDEKTDTLACKVVTCFKNNEKQDNKLPNILANILLFDTQTGKLKCVMEGTEITAWRTAGASIAATKYLYFKRENPSSSSSSKPVLAIIGCGVQGDIHAYGFGCCFDLSEIRLWNRTRSKAEYVAEGLQITRNEFVNKNLKVSIAPTIELCVANADIIVTATFSSEPVISRKMLKSDNVHINAVGAGINHHSEIDQDIYDVANVFIDNWENAKTELKDLKSNIVCEVGEIMNGSKTVPEKGITIFQSLGMASEDAAVAQAVFNVVMKEC